VIPVNTPLLDGNEKKYVLECLESGWISSEGPFVSQFEEKFAARVGREYGIAVCNGSVALDAAVVALGLGKGDEVILPTFTIISCAAAIVRAGAVPVVVDSDPLTWNMDVSQIEAKITSRTRAIMVVHIYGLPVDMDPVLALAQKHGLKIIEDAAEAHGQTYRSREREGARGKGQGERGMGEAGSGQIQDGSSGSDILPPDSDLPSPISDLPCPSPCGSFGDISTFSFYPNKHITTGEGGMIVTDDAALAEKCRSLRNLCFQAKQRFLHEELGWNFRFTNLQAALGLAQLESLDRHVQRKREMGRRYTDLLGGVPDLQLPLPATDYADNIYWVYGIVLGDSYRFDASEAMRRLSDRKIGTRPFFWPMHEQPVFRRMGLFAETRCPVAERLARRGFYLPSGLALSDEEIDSVAQSFREILQ
jgi:perosamine synthetase